MEITVNNVGKRFNKKWIFRMVDLDLSPDNAYLIQGPNGSGKSTLLQLIAGFLSPSEGYVAYHRESEEIPEEYLYKHISIAAPYLELHDDLTLEETISLYSRFKTFTVQQERIPGILGLEKARNLYLRDHSSGMKQRVRLGLAILSTTPLLLLDEPLSNLDQEGKDLYHSLIREHSTGRTVMVCSNNAEEEGPFCNERYVIQSKKLQASK